MSKPAPQTKGKVVLLKGKAPLKTATVEPAAQREPFLNEEIALAIFTLLGLIILSVGVLFYANPNDIQGRIAGQVSQIVGSFGQGATNSQFVPAEQARVREMDGQYIKDGLLYHEKVDIARLVVLQTITKNASVEEKIFPITSAMLGNASWNVENGKPYSLLSKHQDLPPRLKSESQVQKERESLIALRASLMQRFE